MVARLVNICAKVKIPQDDKNHFYELFGELMKQSLSVEDVTVFYKVLQSFMAWAETSDCDELSFMVPNDEQIQSLLQMFMANKKITC